MKMNIKKSMLWMGCAAALLMAAPSVQAQDDPVLLTVGGEEIHKSEFEYMFKKNNREEAITKEVLDEYLDLYIKFRLKVRAAEALGMDTAEKFQKELASYRRQVSRAYLTDHEMNDALLQEAYDRTKNEVRASHILIKVDRSATPEDTLAAYNRIMALRNRIKGGEDFAAVATGKGGSEDPSVVDNKGDLGYFKALDMVYPFETAAYNTPVGEVSMPVRTRFGYHLIHVTGKREAQGQIRVAHIMVAAKQNDAEASRTTAKDKIDEIYKEVMANPEKFAELAQRYSDDKSSARKGGELPMFGTGRMVEEFETAAFALEKDGDISKPVRSAYGWHIIKRLEKKELPSFDALQNSLKSRIQRDDRSKKTQAAFIAKLKEEYGYVEYPKYMKLLHKQMDTTILHGTWQPSNGKKLSKKVLYVFNEQAYTVMDFAEWLVNNQKKEKDTKQDVQAYVMKRYNDHINEMIMAYENEHLEEKHQDFRLLMKEYRDGILLFELTDDKVWSKAVRDTAGLKEFHARNNSNYMWSERLKGTIYYCKDEKIANRVLYLLKKGKGNGEIVKEINADSPLNLKIDTDRFVRGANPVVDMFEWTPGTTKTKELNGQVVFIVIDDVLKPEPKKLDEARGVITSDYQTWLEEEWIKTLREHYEVSVNEDVLYSIQ